MTVKAPVDVKLTDQQYADAGKCGSCTFFKRSEGAGGGAGWCTFKLPPFVVSKKYELDGCEEPARTYDTDSCDLYHAMNARFTKQISWTVPQG